MWLTSPGNGWPSGGCGWGLGSFSWGLKVFLSLVSTGGWGVGTAVPKARSRRFLGSHPRASPQLARGGPISSPFPLNWSQEVLTHYSLAGQPWPGAKANRPPAGPGGWSARLGSGRHPSMPGPCFGQPALPPASPAQPSPDQPRGQALAQPPPALGPAVPVGLVLPRASLSVRGEATSASLVATPVPSPAPTSPRGSGGGGGSQDPQTCISGQPHRQRVTGDR